MKRALIVVSTLVFSSFVVAQDMDVTVNGSRQGEVQENGDIYVDGSRKGEIQDNGDIYVRIKNSIQAIFPDPDPVEIAVGIDDEQIERVGTCLMMQAQQIQALCDQHGIRVEDLELDLGPLGKL